MKNIGDSTKANFYATNDSLRGCVIRSLSLGLSSATQGQARNLCYVFGVMFNLYTVYLILWLFPNASDLKLLHIDKIVKVILIDNSYLIYAFTPK